MRLDVTPLEFDRFLKRLGRTEHEARQNYFRWLEYPLALSLLDARAGDAVLEVGAGHVAATSLYLAAHGCRVTASDLKPADDQVLRYVDGLRGALNMDERNLAIEQADARELPYESGRFERVLCVSTLEHSHPFDDALIARQLGRVLAPDGLAVITVPFNHGEHIEENDVHGVEYLQRHYNEYTLRERLLAPSGLHLERALIFGEVDAAQGDNWRKLGRPQQVEFCRGKLRHWQRFWTVYYELGAGDFYIDRDKVADSVQRRAGLVALLLRKAPLTSLLWDKYVYDPLKSFRENARYVRPFEHGPGGARLSAIQVHNLFGAPLEAFSSGETLIIRGRVEVRGRTAVVLRAAFEDDQGRTVARLDAPLGDPLSPGFTDFEVKFGMLNLGAGTYELTLGLWDKQRPDPLPPVPLDVHAPATRIVVGNDKRGLSGPAYLPYAIKIGRG